VDENAIFNLKVRHQTHLFVIIFHAEIVHIYVLYIYSELYYSLKKA